MFKRRRPLTRLDHIKELFWPSMGWWRAFQYARHRILRLSDSTHKIAAGLAIGACISFTPPGTHFIQAGFVAYLVRANILCSLIGTFVGNPWTFPFLWWSAISFGSHLFSLLGLPAGASVPDHTHFKGLFEIATHEPMRIFLPWTAGGYLLAVLTWPAIYIVCYHLVRAAKIARAKSRLRSLHKTAQQITGQQN